MGLFGKMFEKKTCAICGEEIKLLGNRKLSDGNLCKNCASKLSPWFSDRKQSTVSEIQEQLEYRENNQNAVDAFELTRTLGKATKVLLDENNSKFMITSNSNYAKANPDVLDFAQVTGCDIDVNENKRQLQYTTKEGKHENFNPAQYDYSYDFYVTVYVNHPYFNQMRFKVNASSIDLDNPYVTDDMPKNQVPRNLQAYIPNPQNNVDYREAKTIANEIKEALTKVREDAREEYDKANEVKGPVVCSCCGATTIPDANGCCEYCGRPVA